MVQRLLQCTLASGTQHQVQRLLQCVLASGTQHQRLSTSQATTVFLKFPILPSQPLHPQLIASLEPTHFQPCQIHTFLPHFLHMESGSFPRWMASGDGRRPLGDSRRPPGMVDGLRRWQTASRDGRAAGFLF
ncbi:hypothetical protein P7K49_009951 [Saguinus oedipus]|uniref:Uncharacterized protein n=1 Tax=Saguinus oedipus TaxID=9490 RepID=A0ABQ9VM90_SAGOE|nr:hypothetical protein P7K49_009951 [Saguinus oedipus]